MGGLNDPRNTAPGEGWMTRAAGQLANAGFRYLFSDSMSSSERATPDSWVMQFLGQHRSAISEYLAEIPKILERTAQLAESATGHRALYRSQAKDTPPSDKLHCLVSALHEAMDSHSRFGIGRDLFDCFEKKLPNPLRLDALTHLLDPDWRGELPSTLEELKHIARTDRAIGLHSVFQQLGRFLCKDLTPEDIEKACAALDTFHDVLGSSCSQEIFRLRLEHSFFGDRKNCVLASTKYLNVKKAYGELLETIGLPVLDKSKNHISIAVLHNPPPDEALEDTSNPPLTYLEYRILDHERDAVYQILGTKRDSGIGIQFGDLEFIGPAEGRAYALKSSQNVGLFRLPFRVTDASQAFATWTVDRRFIQDALDAKGTAAPRLRAWNAGADRCMMLLTFVDYRDSDFKAPTYDLMLTALVAPEDDPLAVGLYPLAPILVSSEESSELAKAAWGFEKELIPSTRTPCETEPHWKVEYRSGHVRCDVGKPDQHDVRATRITFPRRGQALSPAIPICWYTLKNNQWHRVVVARVGSRESIRLGGSGFSLEVNPDGFGANTLQGLLYQAGIIDEDGQLKRKPIHTGWTEHFTASIAPAVLLAKPDADPK